MARHHDEMAREVTKVPDRYGSLRDASVPWVRTWDATAEHERLATVHRSQAAALQAAYEETCGNRSLAEVSVSPLVRYGIGSWNTSTGVIMYLSPDAGPPDRLLAELKCHRAWMMLTPVEGMDECPLDLPGIQLDARGDRDSITVSIVIRDPKLVPELRQRAAHDLEAGAQLRKSH